MKKTTVTITIFRMPNGACRALVDDRWIGEEPHPLGRVVLCQFEIQVSDLLKLIPQLW